MRVACVSEGDTEFFCVPKLVGRLGHVIVSNVHVGGCANNWDHTFEFLILPYVKTAALKKPDKIIIVVDREDRPECCPELSTRATTIIADGLHAANLEADFSVIICDRTFEVIVMSDYDLIDKMEILSRPVSHEFGAVLDGKNPLPFINRALRPGKKYHKIQHGGALASKMRLEEHLVLSRSRSLRKLLKELQ